MVNTVTALLDCKKAVVTVPVQKLRTGVFVNRSNTDCKRSRARFSKPVRILESPHKKIKRPNPNGTNN